MENTLTITTPFFIFLPLGSDTLRIFKLTAFWLWLWLGVGKSSCVEAQEASTVESGFEVVCPSSVLARTLWSSEIIEAIQGFLRQSSSSLSHITLGKLKLFV